MKIFAATSVFVLIMGYSPVFAQGASEAPEGVSAQCSDTNDQISALQDDLPKKVDYMTDMVGIFATMTDTGCIISVSYEFDEEILISQVSKGSDGNLDENEAMDFLQSPKGKRTLKHALKEQSKAIFETSGATGPGISYQMTYMSNGENLDPIAFEF